MTDLRLALFTDTFAPQMNGVARTLNRLVSTVRERGGSVRIFTCTDPQVKVIDADVRRYPSIAVPVYPELRLSIPSMRQVERDLRDFAPTLIHAATPFGVGLAGRRAARTTGIPFVTSYHTSFSAYASFYHLGWLARSGWEFLKWFHNSGQRTYCPTRTVQRELAERGFENLFVWSRGVSAERFSPANRSRAMRMRMGGADDAVIVAYVGRIAKEKGIDHLLAAANELADVASIKFAFAGDGPHLEQCRSIAPPSVTFLGRLEGEELAAFYASADVFVFPSVTDTFGNVLLEAMASGLPIVAADTPTTREVVGDAACYYPGSSARGLVEPLLSLTSERWLGRHLAGIGLARSRQFRWDAVFDSLIADYESVQRPTRARLPFASVRTPAAC